MPTPSETQAHVDAFLTDLLPAKIIESSANVEIIVNFLRGTGQEMTSENLLAAVRGINAPLRRALQWAIEPEDETTYLPPVPAFLDFIRTKSDIQRVSKSGDFARWMKTRHRNALNDRVNYILQHNIVD